jgi:hypothetical protein
MISVLDFGATPGAAFRRGLAKGLAAPFALYGSFKSSVVLPPVAIVRPARIGSVWEAAGADLRAAMAKHERSQ